MKKNIFIGIAAILVVAGFVVAFWGVHQKARDEEAPGVDNSGLVAGGTVVSSHSVQSGANGQLVAGGTVSMKASPLADPAFHEWIQKEALDVDKPKVDAVKKRKELSDVIAALTPTQAHQLLQTALSEASSSAEKILSVYLLGEGGLKTRAQLVELIVTPLPDRGAITPHSNAETQAMADRSRLMMSVDALATQAKNDPSAASLLAQAIPHIQDPYVKTQAQRRLDDLGGH